MKHFMPVYVCVMGAALLLTSGCATAMYPGGPTPAGTIVTSVKSPAQALAVALDPSAKATKTGVSSSSAILGLFANGDASVEAAMQNGGITRVHHVDHEVNAFLLGLYLENKTIVHGE
jgi:hypothetical protein